MKNNDISKLIYNQRTISKTEKKIRLLGSETQMDATEFLNLRLFTSVIIFFITIYVINLGYVFSPLITIAYYYLCGYLLLDLKIKKRTSLLEEDAMHFFEVLTLSLDTGRNLEEAIRSTVGCISSSISKEFGYALKKAEYGKSLTESLISMQQYIPSETINNVILTLTQADMFGNSIIETLYNQIDYLREKKKLEVKAVISKVPIKISVISVLFFVPLILLIILSPVILNYLNQV